MYYIYTIRQVISLGSVGRYAGRVASIYERPTVMEQAYIHKSLYPSHVHNKIISHLAALNSWCSQLLLVLFLRMSFTFYLLFCIVLVCVCVYGPSAWNKTDVCIYMWNNICSLLFAIFGTRWLTLIQGGMHTTWPATTKTYLWTFSVRFLVTFRSLLKRRHRCSNVESEVTKCELITKLLQNNKHQQQHGFD